MLDHQILGADRGEAIAIMFQHAFGVARVVGFELQFGPVGVHDGRKTVHRQKPACLDHQRMIEPQLVAQQFLGVNIKIILELQ